MSRPLTPDQQTATALPSRPLLGAPAQAKGIDEQTCRPLAAMLPIDPLAPCRQTMNQLITRQTLLTASHRIVAGFTLIELLVVMAILAVLAGLALPAIQGAMTSGKKAQARNDVQQLAAAIRAFQLEYGRQPSAQTSEDEWVEDNSAVIRALLGEDTTLNPRGVRFFEAKMTANTTGGVNNSSRVFYDPWGSPYFLKLNSDYDNVIEYYGDNSVTVIVGSRGPNKEQDDPNASGSDDIVNFK